MSCSFKLLNITAEVAYDTFYICGILLSILFDILLIEPPISKRYYTHRNANIQTAIVFRIFHKLVFIRRSACVSIWYNKTLSVMKALFKLLNLRKMKFVYLYYGLNLY
jgi:hypothetical protein